MSASKTVVFGIETRRAEKWRLFQICTANSTYHLEVQDAQPGETRRCAVLTCVKPESRAGQSFEDSAPRAGKDSLFAVTPLDWIGRCLEVGTVRTSDITSVEFLSLADAPSTRRAPPRRTTSGVGNETMVFRPSSPPADTPRADPHRTDERRTEPRRTDERREGETRQWAPFPLGFVEMAEVAAALLNGVAHQRNLRQALLAHPLAKKRLAIALDACRAMLESMERGD